MSRCKPFQFVIGVWSAILLATACSPLQLAETPLPTTTSIPIPTATNTPVPTPTLSTGAIKGMLVDEATGNPVTDLPIMPYGPWNGDLGLWQILTDYKEVYPDERGVFTLKDLSPGTYRIYAITGETTSMGSNIPIMSFLTDSAGNEIEIEVIVGQTADLGQVLVKK